MKLQQLRSFREVTRCRLNISEAAMALHTSQPGISKQIQLLEEELGVTLFVRQRNRLIELTPAGAAILEVADRILSDAESIRSITADFRDERRGVLSVVTTHTQASFTLPRIFKQFKALYPHVNLLLRQGTPNQIWQLVRDRAADIAIASEPIDRSADVVMLPCYELARVVLTPADHPLLRLKKISLRQLAEYPIITYDDGYIAYRNAMRIFVQNGIVPRVVLSATDSNVMKSFVAAGLGVAIIANLAFDRKRDRNLRSIDVGHLFPANKIFVGFRRDVHLRRYVFDFIHALAPHLTSEFVIRYTGNTELLPR